MDTSSHAGVQHFLMKLREMGEVRENSCGLVVGFGEGHEGDYLQNHTSTKIIGIDVHSRIPEGKKTSFYPVIASAMDMPFAPSTFDFVFYHHVIEHVPDPGATLAEIHRVLIPGGLLYVGTPNRHRIIGYIGAYKISLRRKVRNNLLDYKNRLLGKFRNELGAHAGFSAKELGKMLHPAFVEVTWLTREYLLQKYQRRIPNTILKALFSIGLLEYVAPSIYVVCRKPAIN